VGDGGGPDTCPELEAPGLGGVDGEADMDGDVGSDIAKMPGAEKRAEKASFFLCSRRFFGRLNATSVLQAHNRIDPCPA
jgi:hypothetical protein